MRLVPYMPLDKADSRHFSLCGRRHASEACTETCCIHSISAPQYGRARRDQRPARGSSQAALRAGDGAKMCVIAPPAPGRRAEIGRRRRVAVPRGQGRRAAAARARRAQRRRARRWC